jgi:ubiquinone/menaquinone biosynthesis C-methylase UbiE
MMIPTSESLTEAEIQLLIALIELEEPIETPNNNHYRFYPKTLEEAALYFKSFREDWSPAYASLAARGLLEKTGEVECLASAGKTLARQMRLERPPIYYWYREYYRLAPRSRAYALFCERLYGKYLCQTNFSDMQQLERLLQVLDLKPGDRVLDLGCGVGFISEYFSDRTGAHFVGIDYSQDAIHQAQERTSEKRDRLEFQVANMDSLNFPSGCFDAIISIDTLYMPNRLEATLSRLVEMLRPGGKLAAYYMQMIWDASQDRSQLQPENTPLGVALRALDLPFKTWNVSRETYAHMQRKRQIGEEMRPLFAEEGSLILSDNILMESLSTSQPYDPSTSPISRYLYLSLRSSIRDSLDESTDR